ncbi:DUF2283 domain-containing protein [Candidatus Bathyarchaeota archaeon]|nr:DUF2283 domain-containing protein [Candidatus Bathyarchaeota archaeon]
MQIKYDKKADVLYIWLRKATADISAEAAENVIIDLDKAGCVIGIEVLDASKNMGQKLVTKIITAEKLKATA